MVEATRARGAFLGLAAGDAYGRPLEFVRLPEVRVRPVDTAPGRFRWTDDTHMALYLGDALLDLEPSALAPDRLDADALGHAIGRRFVAWSHDPLTPSTAPGGTCLAGASAYEAHGDWRRSGVPGSDGCGAVMRVCPLSLALDGEELVEAARISALVTHAHPNAPAAAVAASLLLRRALDGRFDAGEVRDVAGIVRRRWPGAPDVPGAIEAALVEARATGEWLDEAAVPAGDGGWRSPSALGLAIAAALRWGMDGTPEAFVRAVDRAARIAGDSDSVACLTGMFLGARFGEDVVPAAWRAALPERERIERLALDLLHRDEERRHRTSRTDPLYVDWVLPDRLGITFLPGKRAPSLFGTPWRRDLGADLDRLADERVALLVSLVEEDELVRLGAPGLVDAARARGIRVLRLPIPDGGVPSVEDASRVVAEVQRTEGRVVVHCRGGMGRAGTLASCLLVARGVGPDEAIAQVRAARPGAVENSHQERFVATFAAASRGSG